MADATTNKSAVTSHMARALKNSFMWNHKIHMTDILGGQGPEWPESNAGREAWTAFYVEFAEYLDRQFGREAVSKCLDYLIETKKSGDSDHAISLLVGHPWGKIPTVQPAQPAPTVADPKAIAAQRFAAGEITVAQFTEIITALNAAGVTAAPVGDNIPQESSKESAEEEAPTPFVPILVEDEDEDVDLPF